MALPFLKPTRAILCVVQEPLARHPLSPPYRARLSCLAVVYSRVGALVTALLVSDRTNLIRHLALCCYAFGLEMAT